MDSLIIPPGEYKPKGNHTCSLGLSRVPLSATRRKNRNYLLKFVKIPKKQIDLLAFQSTTAELSTPEETGAEFWSASEMARG
jgi:hypothetical protein